MCSEEIVFFMDKVCVCDGVRYEQLLVKVKALPLVYIWPNLHACVNSLMKSGHFPSQHKIERIQKLPDWLEMQDIREVKK